MSNLIGFLYTALTKITAVLFFTAQAHTQICIDIVFPSEKTRFKCLL